MSELNLGSQNVSFVATKRSTFIEEVEHDEWRREMQCEYNVVINIQAWKIIECQRMLNPFVVSEFT